MLDSVSLQRALLHYYVSNPMAVALQHCRIETAPIEPRGKFLKVLRKRQRAGGFGFAFSH